MSASSAHMHGSRLEAVTRARIDPRSLLPAIVAGLVGGLLALSASISYPAVIFAGALEPYLGVGIGMALLGSAVLGAIIAVGSTYPATIANVQIETAVVLGAAAIAITESLGTRAADEATLATLLAVIVVSAVSLGVVFMVLGVCRLGNAIRYIPYPVIGAFLAYIAWLLLRGGMTTMTGRPPTLVDGLWLLQPATLLHWLPGALAAVALLTLQLGRRHYLNAPAVLVASVGAFWLFAWLAGASAAELRSAGYLLAALSEEQAYSPLTHLAAIGQADWALVMRGAPQVVVVWLVAMITLLISASSLEVASRSDVDLNRELKVTGIANLASGLVGGLPGYHSVSASLLPHYLGTRSRLVGLISAAMCAAVFLAGGPLLAYVPKLLLGLVLTYLALDIAAELVLERWPRLPAADRGILLLVLFSLIWLGFVEGIVIGVIAGLTVFAFSYGRLNAVRAAGTGASYASNVLRPPEQLRLLAARHDAIQVIRLQGYLFFGSAQRLLEGVSARLTPTGQVPLRFLVLDFERVDGADSSTIFSLLRLTEKAQQRGPTVLFAAVPEALAAALGSTFDPAGGPQQAVVVSRDLDHALEHAEEALLEAAAPHGAIGAEHATDELARAIPDPAVREGILGYGECVSWRAGDHVIRQGDQSREMYFVESGRLTARLDLPDGGHVRLRTILPGTVVGEVGCYSGLPRSASVVADRDASAFRFTREALDRMQAERAGLAAAFQEFMARTTAERLAYNTGLLEAHVR